MQKVPLHMLTITHPEKFLEMRQQELSQYPHIRQRRDEKERRRREAAEKGAVPYYMEYFHKGYILNTGTKLDEFRRTWIEETAAIAGCFASLTPRLIYTEENRPAFRWKFECRYDWGDDTNALPLTILDEAKRRIQQSERLTIRQVWLNPTSARFGKLRLPESVLAQPVMANLILGPIYEDVLRRAELKLQSLQNAWWIEYER